MQTKSANQDPVFQEYLKLVVEPTLEKFYSLRNIILQSPKFSPYSNDINYMIALEKTSGDPNEILGIYISSMPNLIMSPSAHLIASRAFAAIGNERFSDFEKRASYILLKCLLSTGNGSKSRPYVAMSTIDEYDILEAIGKKSQLQELVFDNDNNVIFDIMTCTDNSKVYFDISLFYWCQQRRQNASKTP